MARRAGVLCFMLLGLLTVTRASPSNWGEVLGDIKNILKLF